ncbi:hypothetical protein [Actinomadura pelletieri]|nr:hypothetical protein [Actinomadura pelletieri]
MAKIIMGIDTWLVTAFSPSRIQATVEAMTGPVNGVENSAADRLCKQLAV